MQASSARESQTSVGSCLTPAVRQRTVFTQSDTPYHRRSQNARRTLSSELESDSESDGDATPSLDQRLHHEAALLFSPMHLAVSGLILSVVAMGVSFATLLTVVNT